MEIEERVVRKRTIRDFLRQVPRRISETVEHFFYKLGLRIARRPVKWLIGSAVIVLVSLSGLYFFHQEKNPVKLWVPQDSDFVHDTEWMIQQFGQGLRTESMILTADDVLEPEVLVKLNNITQQVLYAQTSDHIAWTDVCFKVPVISGIVDRKKRSKQLDDFFEPDIQINSTKFEPAVHADSKLYCNIVDNLPRDCLLNSIMDIWKYDSDTVLRKSKEEIINDLNNAKASPSLGHPLNFTELLGGVTTDKEGRIISARAVKTHWAVHINFTNVDMDGATFGNDAGTADWATEDILKWELSYLNVLHRNAEVLNSMKNENHTIAIWYEAGRSFGDVTFVTLFGNIGTLSIGFILMFLYVLLIFSDYNWVGWRVYLTIVGLFCVGGAFIVAISVCSALGVPYGPVHTSLPFLLLALGVDDNFLIMASWKEIHAHKTNRNKPLEERVALMLGHAGSAISITSLTDVVAFIIGASTILPSLQSFCIYAAFGVLLTFLFQITFYVAFFTLDARRVESKRNSIVPCIIHENFTPKFVSPQEELSSKIITKLYSNVILTKPGKIMTILITIIAASAGVKGLLQLQQWFDPGWFIPDHSYLSKYIGMLRLEYPDRGYDAMILMGDFNYTAEFPKIISLAETFSDLSTVESIRSWPNDFAKFVMEFFGKDLRKTILEESQFQSYLSKFLFSQNGGKYQRNFRFKGELICGENTPPVSVSTMDFVFKRFHGPHQWIPAMDNSKQVARGVGIDGFVTVWSEVFSLWVTDKLIAQEVQRNVLLALICVMGMTGLLIAELQTCFWIFLCVLLTLLNVCGFMYFWGLTIDIASCIGLELGIGLCVDYAAHVAHAFVHAASVTGGQDRTERAHVAVRYIGAAVAYGAGSTLLALSMMVFSDSYVFHAFLKIFVLVILFGLWHGLFLLPVILSTIGPRSLKSHSAPQSPEKTEDAGDTVLSPLNKETES
ncbi:patched domain-containing protein 3 isoform X1 [Osmia lignaria lignaria]|uniref:NPC intracellular cholesterol transporter 1 homolog 1b-like n=1 Tax=Osmia lignaria TaxID=473952 RepID=UPI0014784E0C|nr:NPC intracellular cholesterol transporter 1 homolog 1b-like [Osmia lignaria]XP_034172297.1 NPC intracellular cholesterol transporter 1 homolog 1b-like [Osmia lignaria]